MLDGRLKLRHLQCFLAVAEERSIQRAAERLAITQPAVSKTLRELEEILGAPLFRRGRRGAIPTTAAEVFLRHARTSVAALEQGVDSLAQARQRGGVVLRLGLLPSVAPCFAPPAVLRFRIEMPGTLLRVASGPNALLLAQLQHRELDIALTRLSDPEHMTGLTFEHLYADALALVVHPDHPLLAEREPGLERALRYPAIVATPGTTLRQSAESLVAGTLVVPERPLLNALLRCCRKRPNLLLGYVSKADDKIRPALARVLGEVATAELDDDLLLLASDSLPPLRTLRSAFRRL